jgi:hypothetical protein
LEPDTVVGTIAKGLVAGVAAATETEGFSSREIKLIALGILENDLPREAVRTIVGTDDGNLTHTVNLPCCGLMGSTLLQNRFFYQEQVRV